MTAGPTISQRIADYAVGTGFDDLPAAVVDYAKLLFLDLLGCALSGVDTEESCAARALISAGSGPGAAGIWGTAMTAGPLHAALVNGVAAHAQELDDFNGCDHSGAVVIPAVLAIAEAEGISDGRRVLEAVVLGYEFGVRCLDAFGGYRAHNTPGWHSTGTCGSIAAAIAGAKLLGLDAGRMRDAIGIAGNMMSGTWSFIADGAMTKRLNAGRAAETGVTSAYLAANGFTGPSQVFEAEWGGIFRTFSIDRAAPELFFVDLGRAFGILRSGIKPYASCRGAHSAIDSALAIRARIGGPERVARIRIRCSKVNFRTLGNADPETRLAAQMSLPYGVAAALALGDVPLDAFEGALFRREDVAGLLAKTRITMDPTLVGETPAVVEVDLSTGETMSEQTAVALGDPTNPVPRAAVVRKYETLAGRALGTSRVAQLRDAVDALEENGRLEAVFGLLRQPRALAAGDRGNLSHG